MKRWLAGLWQNRRGQLKNGHCNWHTLAFKSDEGQDIAEYAVMLAVILAIVVAAVQMIGSTANNVFSSVASSIP